MTQSPDTTSDTTAHRNGDTSSAPSGDGSVRYGSGPDTGAPTGA
ncbi:MAG: hypothetical protein QOK26_3047, partial [Pseudonocardiales bacterium]|nr:hypothetical protein [Pseudonocardiales bacterium]